VVGGGQERGGPATPDLSLAATSRDDYERATANRPPLDRQTANGPATGDLDRPAGDRTLPDLPVDRPAEDRTPPDPLPANRPPGPLPPTAKTPRMHTPRPRLKHGIYWLADHPRVNAEPVDLYVVAGADPDRVLEEGLPTPHLFAVGLLRPPAPESLRPGESLVRVRVGEGGAVDLSSIDVHVPPTLQLLLSNAGESYLLPGGLLERAQVVAGYGVEPGGGYQPEIEFDGRQSLRLRCSGARHGIEGLPADVPRWPRAADDNAYAVFPGPRVAAQGGALAMLSAKPRMKDGYRLLRLRVPRRRAIDVRAAAGQLEHLGSVLSTATALNAERIELILSGRDFDKVTVLQVLKPGRLGWQAVEGLGGVSLADFLEANG
jgi:hypothetical protein